jgi:BirA family biotin operon repressor/biotin-[acetyl-CoA-carboxylase] ligase
VSLLGRKVCGILVEAVSPPTDPGRTRLLIGIGLNVHNSIRQAPPELQSSAIALCDVVSPAPHRGDVLIDLLQELAVQWDWLVHDPDRVRTLWRRYDVLVGRPVTVGEGEAAVSGTCEGIEDDGALRVRTPSGPQRIYSGTVRACDSGGSQ